MFANNKHALGLPDLSARTLTDLLLFLIDEGWLVVETSLNSSVLSECLAVRIA